MSTPTATRPVSTVPSQLSRPEHTFDRTSGSIAAPPTDARTGTPTGWTSVPIKNNRASYLAWGLAYLTGWGSFALSKGADPVLSLPSIVPTLLLVVGLLGATAVTTVMVTRASRGITGPAAVPGQMFGAAWAIGFTALFLLITGVAGDIGEHRIETLMWPAGSGVVVGLLYLMGGAIDRDGLQYTLGVWLALVTPAAVFLGTPALYWVLALGIGGAYVTAAYLEPRRVAAARHAARFC